LTTSWWGAENTAYKLGYFDYAMKKTCMKSAENWRNKRNANAKYMRPGMVQFCLPEPKIPPSLLAFEKLRFNLQLSQKYSH
jgi:hypothetical protein